MREMLYWRNSIFLLVFCVAIFFPPKASGSDRPEPEESLHGGIGTDAFHILRAAHGDDEWPKLRINESLIVGNTSQVFDTNVTRNGTIREDPRIHKASQMVEKLLDALEDDSQKEAGRFNDTINNQGGVLETVARVGHVEDEETTNEGEKPEETPPKPVEEEKSRYEKPAKEEVPVVVQAEQNVTVNKVAEENRKNNIPVEDAKHPEDTTPTPPQSQQPHFNITNSKLSDKKNSTGKETGRRHQNEDVARLIDREDNEYVISHPGKRTQMQFQEDLTLIRDIVTVIVASAIGAVICGLLGQPVILGYLAAGMVVGPGGLHLVHELVQVESLAQFGVVFLLFALGVEFSATKMQGVQAVALGGGCIQILTAMFLGGVLCSSVPQGIFIGAFLSMSSTAVVIKCMMDANMGGTEQGQILLGTLIFQDCALGLLLAVMPALAAKGSSSWTILTALGREFLLLSAFCAVAWILTKLLIPRVLLTLIKLSKNSSELYQLGIVGMCLCISLASQSLGLGLEVGAFVAGLMLSGGPHSEKTLHHVEPVRNLFASLFLASIGMVMNPVFLWQHKDILLSALAVMFFGKTILIAIVVRAFGYGSSISISVGIALAQIGEFSFVLLSRAQGLGLVSRKLYLLLMGTSAFSLVLTPFAFKIVVQLAPRDRKVYNFVLPTHNFHLDFDENKKQQKAMEERRLVKDGVTQTSLNEKDAAAAATFLPQVALRRPFSQVFSGQWKDWQKDRDY